MTPDLRRSTGLLTACALGLNLLGCAAPLADDDAGERAAAQTEEATLRYHAAISATILGSAWADREPGREDEKARQDWEARCKRWLTLQEQRYRSRIAPGSARCGDPRRTQSTMGPIRFTSTATVTVLSAVEPVRVLGQEVESWRHGSDAHEVGRMADSHIDTCERTIRWEARKLGGHFLAASCEEADVVNRTTSMGFSAYSLRSRMVIFVTASE